jgi:ribulose-5-phosphate 4-epimerase/fuculose-1-phosphate aldolase
MINDNILKNTFQKFYISKEESNCPLILDIIKIGKKLDEHNLIKKFNSGIISIKYGKRIIINANYSDLNKIKKDDILEIIDYDPIKKIILIIGPKDPHFETPIHWMIHNARKDINIILQINNEDLLKKICNKYSTTNGSSLSIIDLTKEILKTLRKNKKIIIKNKGIFFIGNNLKEINNEIKKIGEIII